MIASRPPWFESGHQQDCSEFLKYLLDQLHENEKTSHLKKSPSSTSVSSYGSLKAKNGSLGKADLKDGVLLTSMKMKTDDDNSCSDTSSLSSKDNENPSLVEKKFRGKVQTTHQCLTCKTQSKRVETFSDIPLAFPNSASKSDKSPQKILVGGSQSVPTKEERNQQQTDLPSSSTPETSMANNGPLLCVNDLIDFYLKPERLSGDNQYHCDSCGKLQDGERQIQIVESPQYLILTLLRFTYDTKLQIRAKISQDVRYPRTLSIPVTDLPSTPSTSRQSSTTSYVSRSSSNTIDTIFNLAQDRHQSKMAGSRSSRCELYGLSGVIVHSGTSSECGHYYCYARHSPSGLPDATKLDQIHGHSEDIHLDELDLLQDKWYNFNDGRVSLSSYSSFR